MPNRTRTSWYQMLRRCQTPGTAEYDRYTARGITVCERWQVYENFLEDMGVRPEGTTIDRIDNDKGYYKENCRWATVKEQNQNRSDTKNLTFNGVTKCIIEWARETGIHHNTIRHRLSKGWTVERTLTSDVRSPPAEALMAPKPNKEEILAVVTERTGSIMPTYYIKNILRSKYKSLKAAWVLRRLKDLEKEGRVRRVASHYSNMICWDIAAAPTLNNGMEEAK